LRQLSNDEIAFGLEIGKTYISRTGIDPNGARVIFEGYEFRRNGYFYWLCADFGAKEYWHIFNDTNGVFNDKILNSDWTLWVKE
jgi:hypothetical protein